MVNPICDCRQTTQVWTSSTSLLAKGSSPTFSNPEKILKWPIILCTLLEVGTPLARLQSLEVKLCRRNIWQWSSCRSVFRSSTLLQLFWNFFWRQECRFTRHPSGLRLMWVLMITPMKTREGGGRSVFFIRWTISISKVFLKYDHERAKLWSRAKNRPQYSNQKKMSAHLSQSYMSLIYTNEVKCDH